MRARSLCLVAAGIVVAGVFTAGPGPLVAGCLAALVAATPRIALTPAPPGSAAAAPFTPRSVKIGNYFVESPYGIAIVVDDETAFLIEPSWEEMGGKSSYGAHDVALVAPGTTAPDFSFSQVSFQHAGASIRFTWGRSGPAGVVGTIETDRAVALTLRLPATWPRFHTIYTASPDGVTGFGIEPRGVFVPFALRVDPAPAHVVANIKSEA